MRTMFLAAVASAALLAGCGLGAPDYPQFGETAYRIEGMTANADGNGASRTVIYRDGPQMRVEATLPTYGQATIVYDESTNSAYVLNPTAPAAPVATSPATQPTQPGATQTVPPNAAQVTPAAPAQTAAAGVAVRIEDADAPQPLETAWIALGEDNARNVGDCDVAGESGHEWRPREAPAPGVERTACITDDGIVLRVRENDRVLWEATSLQRGPQQASLFGVPTGYQLIDPQATAEAIGENMEQLDSVTGDAPPAQPQQAPPPRG
jgi:hypothetical protein